MSSSSGRRPKTYDEADLHQLTRDDEMAMWSIIEYGTKVGKKFFIHGEEIGEAVRGRFVEAVVRNARVRGHITHRKEVHTILHRCYVDEIRYRFGKKHKRQDSGTLELNDEVYDGSNDGGLAAMEARVYLEQEAEVLSAGRGYREGDTPAISIVARTLADQQGSETMQDVADRAGVSKASVSRACRELHRRLEDA